MSEKQTRAAGSGANVEGKMAKIQEAKSRGWVHVFWGSHADVFWRKDQRLRIYKSGGVEWWEHSRDFDLGEFPNDESGLIP